MDYDTLCSTDQRFLELCELSLDRYLQTFTLPYHGIIMIFSSTPRKTHTPHEGLSKQSESNSGVVDVHLGLN